MSGTLKASVLQDGSATVANLQLDASSRVWVTTNATTLTSNYLNWGDTTTTYGRITGAYTSSTAGYLSLSTLQSGTVTETMRLDNAGNVGIGTTSPASKLNVVGDQVIVAAGAGTSQLGIQIKGTALTALPAAQVQGYIATGDSAIGVAGDLLLAPRTDVGTNIRFITGTTPAERMRIDSSGNLLVGTTTSGAGVATGFRVVSGTSVADRAELGSAATTNATVGFDMYSTGVSAYRFYVDWGGTIHATSTSIAAISDASLKTNVKPLETGLAEIIKLQPRRFDWINGDGKNVAGFIAQEVETVLPDLVSDAIYNEIETKKNLKMGDMIPTLVKAIQELKEEFDAYKASHP